MQGLFVDAIKVGRLRSRALRCLRQNNPDEKLVGLTIMELLQYLDLADAKGGEAVESKKAE